MNQPVLTNQIRFNVLDGDKLIHQSEWVKETGRLDAVNFLSDVRKRMGGNYAYRIERTGDSKIPNPVTMYRYQIKVDEDVYYSKLFAEAEKDEGFAKIKELYPKAEITEVQV